ncbi:TetR/AcrR family transcriptional regulator [Halalkalibacterium halodurans]|jgi:TetR/AcrR family transcriptional regulator|uniref:TetR family transcriptional regulator n=1 Tax=Halalkalibacterium halodurans TaxID=86665 RepID=A0A0M0KJG4_ALKHA|nr:TetR/AcrR family transcriptional regulator [Halalkalibacterium halodurans]MED4161985.1 TetR/AcrR family transcriptional regulator [Halalkalibacterium halodurans]TPE68790.1 TetR/AcrR family transcriptional regulator [Halalkalibacterium halodurans]
MVKNKRNQILEAASRSFSLFGYKGTTIDQVAKMADVGKGTVYTAFENKEDLFHAVLQRVIDELKAVFAEAIKEDQDGFENITSALDELHTFKEKHQLVAKLADEVRVLGSESANKALQQVEYAMIDLVKQLLIKAERNGKIHCPNPQATAFLLYKSYLSLVTEFEENYAPLEKEELIDIFKLHFMHGITKDEA